jgi:hypothetical protein
LEAEVVKPVSMKCSIFQHPSGLSILLTSRFYLWGGGGVVVIPMSQLRLEDIIQVLKIILEKGFWLIYIDLNTITCSLALQLTFLVNYLWYFGIKYNQAR